MQIIIYSISVENDCLKHIVPLKVILVSYYKEKKPKKPKIQKNKAWSFCWTIGYCIFLELIPVNTAAGVMKLYMPEKGW